jgi:hypothetical protein
MGAASSALLADLQLTGQTRRHPLAKPPAARPALQRPGAPPPALWALLPGAGGSHAACCAWASASCAST